MKRILFALVVGLAGAAVLVWLGTWQVQRLAWTVGILDAIETRIAADPIPLPDFPDVAEHKYAPVAVTGQYGAGEVHVLVSQKHVGAGYRVIAPFVTTEGRHVLVDRGFIPTEAKDAPRRTGDTRVTGNLHWPDDRTSSTPANDAAGNIWFARDIPDMARALKTDPVLIIARDETPAAPGITPLPVDTAAIPNDHLHYAITWFSLAALWLGMTGFYIYHATRKKDV